MFAGRLGLSGYPRTEPGKKRNHVPTLYEKIMYLCKEKTPLYLEEEKHLNCRNLS